MLVQPLGRATVVKVALEDIIPEWSASAATSSAGRRWI